MKPRIVVDTNLWIRALLGGPATLPLLEAWRAGKFLVLLEYGVKLWGISALLTGLGE